MRSKQPDRAGNDHCPKRAHDAQNSAPDGNNGAQQTFCNERNAYGDDGTRYIATRKEMTDNATRERKNVSVDCGSYSERRKRIRNDSVRENETDNEPNRRSHKKSGHGLHGKREPVPCSCFHKKHILPKALYMFRKEKNVEP